METLPRAPRTFIGAVTDRAAPNYCSGHIIRFTVRPDSAEALQEVFGRALPHILEDTTTVSWFVGREEGDPSALRVGATVEDTGVLAGSKS